MNSLAGAWLKTSVATVFTIAMSSTIFAWCGNSSRDPRAVLAVLRELPAACRAACGVSLNELSMKANRLPSMIRVGDRLAVQLDELRLVVEQLELARAAGHEQVDDVLRARRGSGGPRRLRIGDLRSRLRRSEQRLREQRRQRDRADADGAVAEEVAAGDVAQRVVHRRPSRHSRVIVSSRFSIARGDHRPRRELASASTPLRRLGRRRVGVRASASARIARAASSSSFVEDLDARPPPACATCTGGTRARSALRRRRASTVLQRPRRQRLRENSMHAVVVQQVQRLERRVRADAARAGCDRVRRVERRQQRVQRVAERERVHPAAVAVRARARLPLVLAPGRAPITPSAAAAGRRSGRRSCRAAGRWRRARRRARSRRRAAAATGGRAACCTGRSSSRSGRALDDCRYVADVTISRCMCLQAPLAGDRTPSPASRAAPGASAACPACRSRSPSRRSRGRSTAARCGSPSTRAVSGFSGSMIHCARSRRGRRWSSAPSADAAPRARRA